MLHLRTSSVYFLRPVCAKWQDLCGYESLVVCVQVLQFVQALNSVCPCSVYVSTTRSQPSLLPHWER